MDSGRVSSKDMHTPPSPLRNSQIFIKDAQCVETTEKLILRFLFFELWLSLFTIFNCFYRQNMVKILSQKMRNVLKRIYCSWGLFCASISYWDIVDFVLDIHIELIWDWTWFIVKLITADFIYSLRWHTWIFKISFRSGQIYRKDTQWAETNEN